MFENENENHAIEEVAENVEETTEETAGEVEQEADEPSEEKIYTQKEFEERVRNAVDKRVSRREAKIHRDYQRKDGELAAVLRAGTQKEDVAEITGDLRKFYEEQGVQIPKNPSYSNRDIEMLAAAEADEIIKSGYEEVKDELDRLGDLGARNMSQREKEVFKRLADYERAQEKNRELAKLGVPESVYESKEFKDFANQFHQDVSVTKIYEMYNKTKPKKEVKPMGSMKSGKTIDKGVKEHYTVEEARQFTKADLDKNPELVKAIERSMQKW